MGKLGMGIGLTVIFSIHSSTHSNIEFKTFVFFLPPHRNNQMTMLAVFTGAHRDAPKFPDTMQFSTHAGC